MDLTTFFNLLTIIGVLFLVMVVGYGARKRGIINDVSSNRMSKLIIEIGQPALIIGALVSKPFSWELLREAMLYLAIGFILHPLMSVIGLLFGRFFPDFEERKLSIFAMTFTNAAFIGFPILAAVFPENGVFYGSFFIIGFHVYMWTFGIWLLSRGRDDIKLTPTKALLNFGTVPCAIGLALYLLKALVPMPDLLVDLCTYLGNLCMPISLLITGALIATQDLGVILKNPRLYLFNALKLIALPLIVCAIAKVATLGLSNSYEVVMFCTVISALPSASTVAMLAELYGIKPKYAAQAIGSTSIFSIATLPLLYFIGDFVAKL